MNDKYKDKFIHRAHPYLGGRERQEDPYHNGRENFGREVGRRDDVARYNGRWGGGYNANSPQSSPHKDLRGRGNGRGIRDSYHGGRGLGGRSQRNRVSKVQRKQK